MWGDSIDVFAECRRELAEELSLSDSDVPSLVVAGLVEDVDLRHPEVVLHARTPLPSTVVAKRLDPQEHDATHAVAASAEGIRQALGDDRFTPVSHASMWLLLQAWAV